MSYIGQVPVASTTGVIPNSGATTIGSTTGGRYYQLARPVPGGRKTLLRRDAGTTGPAARVGIVAGATTMVTFDGTNNVLDFSLGNGATGAAIELVGISDSRWQICYAFPGSTYVLLSAT